MVFCAKLRSINISAALSISLSRARLIVLEESLTQVCVVIKARTKSLDSANQSWTPVQLLAFTSERRDDGQVYVAKPTAFGPGTRVLSTGTKSFSFL